MNREQIIDMVKSTPKGRNSRSFNISWRVAQFTGYNYNTVRKVLTGVNRCNMPHHHRWFELAALFLTDVKKRRGEE